MTRRMDKIFHAQVAVVTLYGNNNFGNKLQNYAILKVFEKMGMDGHTIRYKNSVSHASVIRNGVKRLFKNVFFFFLPFTSKAIQQKARNRRVERMQSFNKEFLRYKENVHFNKLPKGFHSKYTFFVTGSDQVWHNWSNTKEEIDYFFLRFAEQKQRVALSASFGLEEIPDRFRTIYMEGLKGFDHLSVREESGVRLIEELTGQKATLLLDPTMILSKDEWKQLSVKPAFDTEAPYIFVYSIGERGGAIDRFIEKIACQNGLKIIDVSNLKLYPQYFGIGPKEFLYLIENAALVCTNSFHASAFSILFQSPFVIFDRIDQASKGNMGNRITTLLEKFNLEDRAFPKLQENQIFQMNIPSYEESLQKERTKFIEFLRMSLGEESL